MQPRLREKSGENSLVLLEVNSVCSWGLYVEGFISIISSPFIYFTIWRVCDTALAGECARAVSPRFS